MKLFIFIKQGDEKSFNLAHAFEAALEKNVEREFVSDGDFYKNYDCSPNCLTNDVFVCFGGDGTILRCAGIAAVTGAKVFAVNTGNLGFLSALEGDVSPKDICREVLSGEVVYEEKPILQGEVCGKTFYAVNEISVLRSSAEGARSESVSLELYIGERFVGGYLADGLIIATPTGSTAYSLSAGGAVLSPELKGFIATAVCPHTLHNRPIVFCDDDVAEIALSRKNKTAIASVYADGVRAADLKAGEKVKIKKSDLKVRIAKGDNFFLKLNKKLQYWGKEG